MSETANEDEKIEVQFSAGIVLCWGNREIGWGVLIIKPAIMKNTISIISRMVNIF
jgi:hypothetical protein